MAERVYHVRAAVAAEYRKADRVGRDAAGASGSAAGTADLVPARSTAARCAA